MSPTPDGIRTMVPRERMSPSARKLRDIYAITPGAPFLKAEMGFFALERWAREGMPVDLTFQPSQSRYMANVHDTRLPDKDTLAKLFDFDPPGHFYLQNLGWCEAAFEPAFEVKVVEDRGEYEVVQDIAGRHLLCFKGRRSGFMPEYLDHPVKDQKTWEENVKWRLDPKTPQRFTDLAKRLEAARAAAGQGLLISQQIIGGCMYLRSLIGPEHVLYAYYDMPEVIHDAMRTWLALADAVTAWHQQHLTFDEVFLAEDICYNHGPLISPEMMREFLLPYYQQLIRNIISRQLDASRHLFVHIDTDGHAESVIELYQEAILMEAMSPFEVASGCDVVKLGRKYPRLVMRGGIDKRIIAQGPPAIDRHLEYILPAMRARGGYYPTCDHGVPEECSYQNYLYYRKRCVELGG
ncbi:MAG: hypothetical protein HYV35_01375 [Lentisphaerae bacterium]|nr:hypothetical protein [Lentisphaerota bacterium]